MDSADTGGAGLEALAFQSNPLEIRVLADTVDDIVVATQKLALVGHHGLFLAKWAGCHGFLIL